MNLEHLDDKAGTLRYCPALPAVFVVALLARSITEMASPCP